MRTYIRTYQSIKKRARTNARTLDTRTTRNKILTIFVTGVIALLITFILCRSYRSLMSASTSIVGLRACQNIGRFVMVGLRK